MLGGIRDSGALQETIIRPCRDLISREKKYWRPVFGLLLLETPAVRSEIYQQLLSVVPELTHTGTLIIDDIEDNAEIRRGDTCIHRRYGTDGAINAANTRYFLPSILSDTHPDLTTEQRLEFYRVMLASFVRGHFGPEFQEEGIALVRKSGALDECHAEASAMAETAWHFFSYTVPPSEAKVMLRGCSHKT